MSGGAYDYVSFAIDRARYELAEQRPEHPLLEPMELLSAALYALEWEDSGDTGEGSSDEAVAAFLKRWKK